MRVKELRVKTTLPRGLLWAANLVRAAQVLLTGASFLKGPSDGTQRPATQGPAQAADGHRWFPVCTDLGTSFESKKPV